MSLEWDAELEQLIGVTTVAFGDLFHYLQTDGTAFDIVGVFDDSYKRDIVLETGDLGWTTTTPVLGIQLSQFSKNGAAPQQSAFLTRDKTGVRYTLVDSRPDGKGAAMLVLGKAE